MKSGYFYGICIALVLISTIYSYFKDYENDFFLEGEKDCNGRVVAEPDKRDSFVYLIILTDNDCDSIKIRAKVSIYPEINYGDRVHLAGKVTKPENFEMDTGRTFHYEEYLLKDDIVAVSFYPSVIRLEQEHNFSLQRSLINLKNWFVGKINEILPSPHAELLGGLVVGAKQSLGEKLLEDFRIVGLIHIVVLSGFNVVIIIAFISSLLNWLPRQVSLSITVIFVILFAMLVGLNPPIVRASLMALISIWGMSTYRQYNVHRAFILTVTLMVLQNPMIVLYDPSFQLSTLATSGLLYISPLFKNGMKWITEKCGCREIVLSTIATYIAVAPFLLYMMGELSVISLIVNLLVLPIIPITMLVGFLATLFYSIIGFTFLLDYISYILLSYTLFFVDIFSRLPFAIVEFKNTPGIFVFLMYLILCTYLFVKRKSLSGLES